MFKWFIHNYRLYLGLGMSIFIFLLGLYYLYNHQGVTTSKPIRIENHSNSVKDNKIKTVIADHQQKQWHIDVKGAVRRPGVYVFKRVPLVKTVVERAGGYNENVEQNRINLAAKVQDGQVIYIPAGQEVVPSEYPLPGMNNNVGQSDENMSTTTSAKIDINQAITTDLEQIPGIGAKRADEIISYRDKKHGIQNLKELQDIPGIGEKTYLKLLERLYI